MHHKCHTILATIHEGLENKHFKVPSKFVSFSERFCSKKSHSVNNTQRRDLWEQKRVSKNANIKEPKQRISSKSNLFKVAENRKRIFHNFNINFPSVPRVHKTTKELTLKTNEKISENFFSKKFLKRYHGKKIFQSSKVSKLLWGSFCARRVDCFSYN